MLFYFDSLFIVTMSRLIELNCKCIMYHDRFLIDLIYRENSECIVKICVLFFNIMQCQRCSL